MGNEPVQAPTLEKTTEEVARIRDIIFGTQMRDYEQRFQALQRDVQRLQKALDALTEQLSDQDSSQEKKLQALRREVRKADDELRDELRGTAQKLLNSKVERVDLGQMLIELGTQLRSGSSLDETLHGLAGTGEETSLDR